MITSRGFRCVPSRQTHWKAEWWGVSFIYDFHYDSFLTFNLSPDVAWILGTIPFPGLYSAKKSEWCRCSHSHHLALPHSPMRSSGFCLACVSGSSQPRLSDVLPESLCDILRTLFGHWKQPSDTNANTFVLIEALGRNITELWCGSKHSEAGGAGVPGRHQGHLKEPRKGRILTEVSAEAPAPAWLDTSVSKS